MNDKKARTHRRPQVKRDIRAAKKGNARDAIGTLEKGCELYILTYGQFSLVDALVAMIEQTGPADVVLCTWTAAQADLSETQRLLQHNHIRDLRIILDQNMLRRPNAIALVADMRERFGDECIRATSSHAKFLAIRNDNWSLAVRTSMNLNNNPRMENIEISDDPALCAFLEQVADDVFVEQQPGLFDTSSLPDLDSVPNVPLHNRPRMGRVETQGLVKPSVGVRTL